MSNDAILAETLAKYGSFPDGEPAPESQTADEIAAETAPIITEAVADEPAPETQTQKAQSAGEVVPAPAAPGIDEIVAKAVAAAVAAVQVARPPEAPPSQAPPAPAFSVESFLANPAKALQAAQIPMEYVARSLVSAQLEAQGQRPPVEWQQPTVYPQIAAMQAQNAAMLSAMTEMQAESRYDKYLAGVGPELDTANADAFPHLSAARGTNRALVMARINARLPDRKQFSDPKAAVPKIADILKDVERDLADAAALLGSVPKVPPVKKPVATPSALRGSPPVIPGNSVSDAERQIRDDVLRRYQ